MVNTSSAQIPRQISYQGLIADGSGTALTGTHSITIKIYSPSSTVLHSETFPSVNVVKGVFSVVIGSTTAIPGSVAFDQQYQLGISVDGGTELSPRTSLVSVPYALMADGLSSNAAVVSSVNSQSGAITLQGGGGTTITNTGSAFTISSSGSGGTGIQGVQNTDGSLTIANPNGPTATLSIANNGVKMANIAANAVGGVQILGNCITDVHIADGAISVSKLKGGAATNGQVLSWNGSTWAPAAAGGGGGLTLPFSSTVSDNGTLFAVTNSGTGKAITGSAGATSEGVVGYSGNSAGVHTGSGVCGTSSDGVGTSGLTSTGDAIYGFASSTGNGVHGVVGSGATSATAGLFEIGFSSNTGDAVDATNAGTGRAGYFRISNTSSSAVGVDVSNAGTGDGLFAESNYNAVHGYSHTVSTNKSNGKPQITGVWNGVFGETDASYGYGVKGENNTTSTSGIGVYGYAVNGYGLYGQADTSFGVYGYVGTGYGVYGNRYGTTGSKAGVAGVSASTSGGSGTDGTVGAVGVFGQLSATTGGAYSAAVRGANMSTTGNGVGVAGYQNGSGWGVYGYSASGTGGRFYTGSASASVYAVYSDGHAYKSDGNASWSIASDENLKTNIRPFTDGLNVISQINPIWYQYNGKAGTRAGEDHVGVLAQDMQAAAPYTVAPMKAFASQDDVKGTDILSYNPSALTYVQINAIKELNDKLQQMQSQMAQLQGTIDVLTQTLKANGITPPASVGVTH